MDDDDERYLLPDVHEYAFFFSLLRFDSTFIFFPYTLSFWTNRPRSYESRHGIRYLFNMSKYNVYTYVCMYYIEIRNPYDEK